MYQKQSDIAAYTRSCFRHFLKPIGRKCRTNARAERMESRAALIVIVNIASAPLCVRIVRLTALSKCKNKLPMRKIKSIHENRFDFEILDIGVG